MKFKKKYKKWSTPSCFGRFWTDVGGLFVYLIGHVGHHRPIEDNFSRKMFSFCAALSIVLCASSSKAQVCFKSSINLSMYSSVASCQRLVSVEISQFQFATSQLSFHVYLLLFAIILVPSPVSWSFLLEARICSTFVCLKALWCSSVVT